MIVGQQFNSGIPGISLRQHLAQHRKYTLTVLARYQFIAVMNLSITAECHGAGVGGCVQCEYVWHNRDGLLGKPIVLTGRPHMQ